MLACVWVFVNAYSWLKISNINIPIKNENNDVINVMISLFIWVLFDFDFIGLEFAYDLNELFILHVEVFLYKSIFMLTPCRMQIAQGIIDHKI
jgi:hypothetical protein